MVEDKLKGEHNLNRLEATRNHAWQSAEAVLVTHCDEGSSLIQPGLPPGAPYPEAAFPSMKSPCV